MAEKYSFVQGIFGTPFLQLKTTDNVYLRDLLEGKILPSLELYNADVDTLAGLVCYRFDDSKANAKKLFADNGFSEVSALEAPPVKSTMDSWNYPQPLKRLGSANKMTLEVIKQMSSKEILAYQNSVYLADRKNIVKTFFQNMLTKTPAARADSLTSIASTPKAFWNDEASMDTPRPNGQITFDGDHQHFIVCDTPDTTDADDLKELMGLVTEHEGMGDAQLLLWIRPNSTEAGQIKDLSAYRAIEGVAPLVGAINPDYQQSGIVQALINSKSVLGRTASVVGTYKEALVVESPDMPSEYVLCTAYFGDNSSENPLGWREHPEFKGLIMASPTGENPIIGHNAQFRRYLSGYVQNRSAGAALHTGDASWAEPTFT